MILESADAADNDDDGGGGGGGDDRADTNTHQHIPRRGCLHVVVVRARVVDVAGRGRVVVVEPDHAERRVLRLLGRPRAERLGLRRRRRRRHTHARPRAHARTRGKQIDRRSEAGAFAFYG